jgi:hypothetical protein
LNEEKICLFFQQGADNSENAVTDHIFILLHEFQKADTSDGSKKRKKRTYGCRRAMAQYTSAFAWILAFSLFLCMFFHLKTVMVWSLELGVLCKSDRQSGHFTRWTCRML